MRRADLSVRLRASRSPRLAALPTRRPDQLHPPALAPPDLNGATVAAGSAGVRNLSIAVDVCIIRGVDLGNFLATEPVLDRGLDERDHSAQVFHPVSYDDGPHLSARQQGEEGSVRRQTGSRAGVPFSHAQCSRNNPT